VTAAGTEVRNTPRVAETIDGALDAAASARPGSAYFVAGEGAFTVAETAAEVGFGLLTSALPELTEQAVLDWARERLASYKRPRYARVVDGIPRTHAGKTARGDLAAEARRLLPDLPCGEG
jgi:acyl-CoA synthetase (AMP-forming)/AMP-acid ligase II